MGFFMRYQANHGKDIIFFIFLREWTDVLGDNAMYRSQ